MHATSANMQHPDLTCPHCHAELRGQRATFRAQSAFVDGDADQPIHIPLDAQPYVLETSLPPPARASLLTCCTSGKIRCRWVIEEVERRALPLPRAQG
ncbi:hypothetical protein DOTSEDRAFT_74200 [Dothistroma septosporum NZE10]|uniref:Uncharacterized protein n=1 Tax=Dothistroma septosporum (strain NZE10 / CBS 128990) TaxID=675120 RepID=N1PG78_DOTSN|nr:hypothetical protein DOTSEDRAFT_74200 [Dothistroma septosporum NZE10]